MARSSSLSNSGNLSRLSKSASLHATDPHSTPLDPSIGTEGLVQHSDSGLAKSGRHSGDRQYSGADHMGSGQLPAVAEVQTASEQTDSEELSATAETASQDLTVPSQQDLSEWANADASEAGSQAGAAPAMDEEATLTSAQGDCLCCVVVYSCGSPLLCSCSSHRKADESYTGASMCRCVTDLGMQPISQSPVFDLRLG